MDKKLVWVIVIILILAVLVVGFMVKNKGDKGISGGQRGGTGLCGSEQFISPERIAFGHIQKFPVCRGFLFLRCFCIMVEL